MRPPFTFIIYFASLFLLKWVLEIWIQFLSGLANKLKHFHQDCVKSDPTWYEFQKSSWEENFPRWYLTDHIRKKAVRFWLLVQTVYDFLGLKRKTSVARNVRSSTDAQNNYERITGNLYDWIAIHRMILLREQLPNRSPELPRQLCQKLTSRYCRDNRRIVYHF